MSGEDKYIQDEAVIQKEFDALINDYLQTNHRQKVEIITKAFQFANEAHKGIRRRDGDPYIMHPLAVARIVCGEIGLGSTSICSALLHDVIEDTEYTEEDLRVLFGDKIALIVEGLTKISSGMFGDKVNVSTQAENFRKLLLTMSDDIRVILIKIADRLHNMRTLGSMTPAKQYKIAGETMFIYAPLAHRLGLFAIKTELEDLSFKWENPKIYQDILTKLDKTHGVRKISYDNFAEPLSKKIDELGFKYEIKAREKSVFSIWNKMETKSVPFEEVFDIFAVRIIFDCELGSDEKKRCWDIYSAITDIYKLRPDRIRDWVSRPKANGYQALHLTVMGTDGQWVEIQIRSRRMDEVAEKGFAAHWKYKEGRIEEDAELNKWLTAIKEILENPSPNALDFLDSIKLNLYSQEIFVFTPKGDIRTLPKGATALDFAYELHTNVGDHCLGAKVNHKLVPLSQKLSSGDQVEILSSKTQNPKDEWLNYVATPKARTKIEYALRKQRRDITKLGETELSQAFQNFNQPMTSAILDKIIDYYEMPSKEYLFYAIGNNEIKLPSKLDKLLQKQNSPNVLLRYMKQAYRAVRKTEKPDAEKLSGEKINSKNTYVLTEDSFKHNFKLATCCNPIPGDNVFGYIGNNNEVDVHGMHCPIGLKLKASYGNKIVNLVWSEHSTLTSMTTITITGIDRMGMVSDITKVINEGAINIKSLSIESNDGIFEGKISIYVQDVITVRKLCSQLAKLKGVETVNRVQNIYTPDAE